MTFDIKTPAPIFGGSTGGWLRASQTEEVYSITWTSPKEQIFEIPTGGSAIMRSGENLVYFARKEQCLALGVQLRTFKILDYKIYRIFPNGDVHYLHPKDGVFPEKVNAGRIPVNSAAYEPKLKEIVELVDKE
jgi:photosystem I subunit 2